jgi:hypothetical protein
MSDNLTKALRLFRDAVARSEDRAEISKEEIAEIERTITTLIAADADPEVAIEMAVEQVWPNAGGSWEHDPLRFVL